MTLCCQGRQPPDRFIVLIFFGGGGFVSLRGKGVFTARKLITLVCMNVMEYKLVHITNYTL
jgi:hypothetical protein